MVVKFQRNHYVFRYEDVRPKFKKPRRKKIGRPLEDPSPEDFEKTGSVLSDYLELRLK